MKREELLMPEFLLADQPIKDDTLNAQRMYIYCTQYLTLIEVWSLDFGPAIFHDYQTTKDFTYQDEDYILCIVQNNVSAFASEVEALRGVDHEQELLDKAWAFFEDYLIWEDEQH